MKVLLYVLFLLPAFAQDEKPAAETPPQTNKSVLKPTPGGEAIKPKDYYDGAGYFHPFRRMPKYIFMDQKAIWTSPFHTSKSDAKLWAIFGAGTVLLISTDKD